MGTTLATAYLNGEYLPVDEVRISPLDRGFLFGDAVYEVVPVHAGRPLLLDAHIARLSHSLESLNIDNPYSNGQWAELIAGLTKRNSGGDLAIYIQITRGVDAGRDHVYPDNLVPTVFAMATQLAVADYTQGVKAITLPDNRWGRCDIKATALLANVLARQAAFDAGAVDAILLLNGEVTEGAVSSVLIVEGGELIRRPHGQAVLPGTTTDFVVEVAHRAGRACRDEIISEARLRGADEIWLAGATKGIAPVVRLDTEEIGDGRPGPVWRNIAEQYKAQIDGWSD